MRCAGSVLSGPSTTPAGVIGDSWPARCRRCEAPDFFVATADGNRMTANFDRSFKIRGVIFETGPFEKVTWETDSGVCSDEDGERHLDDTICLHLLGDGEARWREMRADGLISPKTAIDVLLWMCGKNRESRRASKRRSKK